ncbi:MAG: hypothetical protein IKH64_04325, partial [Prevotella sp.]|nr:hypothetical protein [Prevotella sp.]
DPEQVDIEWQINGTLIDYDRYYDHYSDSVTTYDQETGIGPLLHLYVFTNTKFTHYHIKWYRVVVNGVPSSNKVIYHEHLGNEPFDLCCVYGCVGPVHDIACPMWHPNRILYDGEEIDQIGEELYTVADAPEEREDYRFLGWKCGDVVYQPGDEVYVVYDMWFSSEWEYIGR